MLRWGILGTSFISETMAAVIVDDPEAVIQAVAGRRPAAIESFADKFPVVQTYSDYHALIHDPNVDIIYIGLPNHLHHEYVLACVAAGKHILCEKSLTIDMEKSQAIVDAVAAADVFFVEGLMYLHHPFIEKALALLRSGAIGAIRTISGHYCADIAQFVNPDGKGALFNLGCYPVSLLHLMMQSAFGAEIWSDYALAGSGNISAQDGNICEASMTLSFPNGVTARMYTAETYGMFADFMVVGETGTLRFVTNPWLPERSNRLEVTPFDGEPQVIDVPADGDAFYYQAENVREAIAQGQRGMNRPVARLQDSHEIMEILTRWERVSLRS